MRILHLVHDWLFIDAVVDLLEQFDTSSTFVSLCMTENRGSPFKHIKRLDVVEQVGVDTPRYKELLEEPFDFVWVHYVDFNKMAFVKKLPHDGPRVIWSSWGLDYVNVLGMPVFAHRTLFHYLSHATIRESAKYLVGRVLYDLNLDRLRWRKVYRDFFSRVSYFSSVFREEHPLLRRMVPHARAIDFHYLTPKETVPQNLPVCDLTAKRMWIGNSATYTNNHFDVFSRAKKHTAWDVVCPLVYGEIRDDVEQAGRATFGSRWCSITEFMPYSDYMSQMARCSVFAFGHRRQQSVGNIGIALKIGGCVFLDPKNITYQTYKRNGIVVYTLDDFEHRLEESLRDYALKREQNVRRVLSFRGRDALVDEVRSTMTLLAREFGQKS